jgi:hypothetical protein
MGWQLLIQVNRNYFARIPIPGGRVREAELYNVEHITITIETQNPPRSEQYKLLANLTYQQERDYRTSFMTRNWYDAIISGYLYHQSGRECWLSSGGKPESRGWLKGFDWQDFLLNERGRSQYWPSPSSEKTKDLCRYLQVASPSIGLRVYADMSLGFWLQPLKELANIMNGTHSTKNRTLFICYEHKGRSLEKFVTPC